MKIVFKNFEHQLALKREQINVVRIADKPLFSRCSMSLVQGFLPDALEPAAFFDDQGKEQKPMDCLFLAGDLLFLDLNDRKILATALAHIAAMLVEDDCCAAEMEQSNIQILDRFGMQFVQLSADYGFSNEWDASRYLKAFGFEVDSAEDVSLFERLKHFLRLATDLFPDKILAFVNLSVYLSNEEYAELSELSSSAGLIILSYETNVVLDFLPFENGLFIDANYLEYTNT